MSATKRAALVGLMGVGAAVVLSLALGKSPAATAMLMLFAGGGALAVGLAGAALLRGLRRASFALQISIVALTSTIAVGAGAWGAGASMFLMPEDLNTLTVTVVAAAAVSVGTALVLAQRFAQASHWLRDATGRLAEGEPPGRGQPTMHEFSELADTLAETSRRLAAARESERAMERARRELVSWVSHDLRTPLAGIRAISEALEDGVVTDAGTRARYYRTLRVEADRLAGLVDDLFELSKIQSGALALQFESASLGDLVSDALAAADPVASEKRVRLQGRMVAPVPELKLSVPEFSRVLRNLVTNAVRETPADSTVEVEAGTAGDWAWVAVSDACGGIADDEMERLFDTGYRRQNARTPSDDARAGLGLAIAKGLVEAHAGEITVVNQNGGCRFTVRVPLNPAARSSP